MHKEILTKEQLELLPLLKLFSEDFGLVGGTAIALHIGHRESIDFDFFTDKQFENDKIKRRIAKIKKIERVFKDEDGQYTIDINRVRATFFRYPFPIKFSKNFDNIIKLPDLLTLAAMKSFALGRRAKWKDYVDLYFITRDYFPVDKIIKKAKQIFGNEFNEKIFRVQLSYFKDVNYSEKIIYMKGYEISDEVVKKGLIKFSLRQ